MDYVRRIQEHQDMYQQRMGKSLSLNPPMDLNEKIHWLEIFVYGESETRCSDKYAVRQYVSKMGCAHILTKLYSVCERADQILFEELPDKFVLKTNHSCHCVHICRNKASFDKEAAIQALSEDLNKDFSKKKHEYHYSAIPRKIICEELIDDGTGKAPLDYKFFCFNGEPACVLVCSDRDSILRQNWFDLKWEPLDYNLNGVAEIPNLEKPAMLPEMIEVARKLSRDFPFVRVDLYCTKNKVFFGELTFTPCAGFIDTMKQDALNRLGEMIDTEKYRGKAYE